MADEPAHSDTPPKSVTDLPFDLLLEIFHLLPSRDLVNLLCCCRNLFALVGQESIWRNMSSLYGLHDIAHFGGRSWYTVYTRLLHTYGPMLGLWAGDNAYTGGILDVRLYSGDTKLRGGIYIDLCQFRFLQPEDMEGPEKPELPMYIPLVRIDFSSSAHPHGNARPVCCSSRRGIPPAHRATIQLFSSSNQSRFLHTRQGQFPHPAFPGPAMHSVFDGQSRYPLLPLQQTPAVDQQAQLSQRPRIPVVFTAPAEHQKPQAISVSCPHGCIERIRPFLGFDDIVPFLPRYYPLRHTLPRVATLDPVSPDWQPAALVGLWLGSHGPHGTECLYFDLDGASAMLRAWKITGDENVPRGALTFEVNTVKQVPLVNLPACAFEQGIAVEDVGRYRGFAGSGTISARGFLPHQTHPVDVVLLLGEPDRVCMVWVEMEECSAYIRYRGRDR